MLEKNPISQAICQDVDSPFELGLTYGNRCSDSRSRLD